MQRGSGSPGRFRLVLAIVLAGGLVAGGVFAISRGAGDREAVTSPSPREPRIGGITIEDVAAGEAPWQGATKATLDDAEKEAGLVAIAPNSERGSTACLTTVWTGPAGRPDDNALVEVFSSKIVLYHQPAPDPPEDYSVGARLSPSIELIEVQDVPAFSVAPTTSHPSAEVGFVTSGSKLLLFGYMPTAELVKVAETIGPTDGSTPVSCATPS